MPNRDLADAIGFWSVDALPHNTVPYLRAGARARREQGLVPGIPGLESIDAARLASRTGGHARARHSRFPAVARCVFRRLRHLHSLYRSFVGLWVNAVVIGYIVGWPLFPMLAADVEQLTPAMEPADRIARTHGVERSVVEPRSLGRARYRCHLRPDPQRAGGYATRSSGVPDHLAYVWVPVVIPLLWATILPALWRLIRLSLFVRRLGTRVRVDLGDPRVLGVFADIGIRHLLVIIVGLSVIPMQAILTGQIATVDFVPALVVTVPVALIVLVLPMWGISWRGDRRETDRTRSPERTRRLHRNTTAIAICCCRCIGRQVADTSEWPASAGAASRVVVLRRDSAAGVDRRRARAEPRLERIGLAMTLLQSDAV